MVKGISRRVIVVRPASGSPFEQAFFLVRDAACPRGDAVREACRIAEGCLGTRRRRRGHAPARGGVSHGRCRGERYLGHRARFLRERRTREMSSDPHRRFSHFETVKNDITACIFRHFLHFAWIILIP